MPARPNKALHRAVFWVLCLVIFIAGAFFYLTRTGTADKVLSLFASRRVGEDVSFAGVRVKAWNDFEFQKAWLKGPHSEPWAASGKGELRFWMEQGTISRAELTISDLTIEAPLSAQMNFHEKPRADRAVLNMRRSGRTLQITGMLYDGERPLFRAAWEMADGSKK